MKSVSKNPAAKTNTNNNANQSSVAKGTTPPNTQVVFKRPIEYSDYRQAIESAERANSVVRICLRDYAEAPTMEAAAKLIRQLKVLYPKPACIHSNAACYNGDFLYIVFVNDGTGEYIYTQARDMPSVCLFSPTRITTETGDNFVKRQVQQDKSIIDHIIIDLTEVDDEAVPEPEVLSTEHSMIKNESYDSTEAIEIAVVEVTTEPVVDVEAPVTVEAEIAEDEATEPEPDVIADEIEISNDAVDEVTVTKKPMATRRTKKA